MRFQKVNLKSDAGNNASGDSQDKKNVSHCIPYESSFSEIRKSLDILEDVFSDIPYETEFCENEDEEMDNQNGTGDGRIPLTASEMLQMLSKGGMTEAVKPENPVELPQSKDGSESNSESLLQLVKTDHPYLGRNPETDGIEEPPAKSGSCSSIPDAEIIHDFFLHTTSMISYRPIAEVGCAPAPNTVPTLIGCPRLSCRTSANPDVIALASKEVSSERRPEDKYAADVTGAKCSQDSVEEEKSKKCLEDSEGEKQSGLKSVSNAEDIEGSTETKEFDQTTERISADDRETCKTAQKENSTSNDAVHVSSVNSTNDAGAESYDHDGTQHKDLQDNMTHQLLQPDESSVFSNMVNPSSLNQIDPNSWTAACKAMTDKVQEDTLIQCAVILMMKVWTDYLTLTFEEVRAREIQAAHDNNYTDDVIAMIEDKDRYVWQLIEEMEPRNFTLTF